VGFLAIKEVDDVFDSKEKEDILIKSLNLLPKRRLDSVYSSTKTYSKCILGLGG
jgi:hypothetical protein